MPSAEDSDADCISSLQGGEDSASGYASKGISDEVSHEGHLADQTDPGVPGEEYMPLLGNANSSGTSQSIWSVAEREGRACQRAQALQLPTAT
jgi:hypothetical protein